MSALERSQTQAGALLKQLASEESRSNYIIPASEIELVRQLGSGGFGVVWKGRCRGQVVAVKVLHQQNMDEKMMKLFLSEIEILSKVRHPNAILFIGVCLEPGKLMIVTELMHTSLEELIFNPKRKYHLIDLLPIVRAAASAMNWLHCCNPKIIHRDLKPGNILLDRFGNVSLSDFGLSEELKYGRNTDTVFLWKGTFIYMAPEVMTRDFFNEKIDVYSFGMILWQLMSRKLPFDDIETRKEIFERVCMQDYRPPIPEDTPPHLQRLIKACWEKNPNDRPSFYSILMQLDRIIPKLAIPDTQGRKFWRMNYRGWDRVHFDDFIEEFMTFVDRKYLHDNNKIALQEALCYGDPPIVTFQSFGRLVACFGPMLEKDVEDPTCDELSCAPFLRRLRDAESAHWYHGHISSEQCVARLMGQPPGTFLIKASNIRLGGFSLVYVAENGNIIRHSIGHTPMSVEVTMNGESYSGLSDLVAKNFTICSKPCPGSKFEVMAAKICDPGKHITSSPHIQRE
mmetsp:Transcript_30239/g.76059  ORF Transcript_30239/g.76059 Transcript_30239/m.76059 type:complete len:512 (+) Transcript_30239:118-1653(+)